MCKIGKLAFVAGAKGHPVQEGENVYVNPMGMAVEDLAVAFTVYRKAAALGIGQVFYSNEE